MTTPSPADQWRALAAHYRTRINAAWWLQEFVPWVVGSSLVGVGLVLYLRSQGLSFSVWGVLATAVLLLAAVATLAYLRAQRHFISPEESLLELDTKLRLHNALTSAAAGVRSWPPMPHPAEGSKAKLLPPWNWRWFALPKLAVLGCLLAAFLLPVAGPEGTAQAKVPPPSSLQQTEEMLQELKAQEAAQAEDLEKFQEQVKALKDKPVEEWYDHAGLEAADHLREALQNAAGGLGENYQQAEKALGTLAEDQNPGEANQKEREQAAQDLAAAVEGMNSGALKPNEDLRNRLNKLNPQELAKSLSKEEAEQLREALKKAGQVCKDCKNGKPSSGEGGGEQSLEEKLRQQLAEGGAQQKQSSRGQGGIQRGPGTQDLSVNEAASEQENGKLTKEQTRDLEHLKSGDLLGTSDGQHEVDKTPLGASQGGSAAAGDGGNTTWRDELTPAEKQVLEKFFK